MPEKKCYRCAIYTRKSSEEGLEQAFNSLDAQREACAAYILSQAGEGWEQIKTHYDDGGFSGGSMDRPDLKQLLDDISAGMIDIIVVYKVDRLTRSLSDFAKIVDILDAKRVSFVSVTQAFNTTTSMGRLTLNVLLSFAQFEREVTGERIRDKIAASRKKGMWMGGNPPLGYDVRERKLFVNAEETKTVRMIFDRYLELRSVPALTEELDALNIHTKSWTAQNGNLRGDARFSRGALYHLLRNRVYVGEATHKDNHYPGEHDAIVDTSIWKQTQDLLTANAAHQQRIVQDAKIKHPLQGMLYDDKGNPMSPSYTSKSRGRYRYYVSQALLQHRPKDCGSVTRVPAEVIEQFIGRTLSTLVDNRLNENTSTRDLVERIEVTKTSLALTMCSNARVGRAGRKQLQATIYKDGTTTVVRIPCALATRGGAKSIVTADSAGQFSARSQHALKKAIARGWRWRMMFESGEVRSIPDLAKREKMSPSYIQKVLRLSFLAPSFVEQLLLDERQSATLLDSLLDADVSLRWAA